MKLPVLIFATAAVLIAGGAGRSQQALGSGARSPSTAAPPILSYALSATQTIWPAEGYPGLAGSTPVIVQTNQWYASSHEWRSQSYYRSPPPAALLSSFILRPNVKVENGRRYWTYDSYSKTVTVQHAGPATPPSTNPFMPLRIAGATNRHSLLAQLSACDSPVAFKKPRLVGTGMVAGRHAYIVDFGDKPCGWNSASESEVMGRRLMWIDERSFFVLKVVLYKVGDPRRLFQRMVVTRVRYDVRLDPHLFVFKPPHGSHAPAPEAGANGPPVARSLRAIRRQVTFPVFVPTWVPAGLRPGKPRLSSQPLVTLTYHGRHTLQVLEGPIGCCLDGDPRKYGSTSLLPNGRPVHLVDVGKQYGGIILWWDQRRTYIALSSTDLSQTKLTRVAASMSSTAPL